MENFKIQLFSTSQLGGVLDIGYTAEQSEIVTDLLLLFNARFDVEKQSIGMDYKHKYTEYFKERLNDFINKGNPPDKKRRSKVEFSRNAHEGDSA